jgi:hypothetical protein
MKKVMFFLSLMLVASVGFVSATPLVNTNNPGYSLQQDDKEKIKPEELPDQIKTTLNGDEYKGWLVQTAYRIKSKDVYEVELKKGAETKTLRFDKEGKVVV